MFLLWLVIALAAFNGAHMDQYVPLTLPHFCICEKSNIMKIIQRSMCIYNSSNGSAYMSDCLTEVDKVFNKCHRNKVSCYHIKFNLELKRNESGTSALQFVRDKKNPARTLILRKNSTNSLDDGYLKRFTIMARVFSTLYDDRQELFDLISLISELKKDKNVSVKPNFYFLILKTDSNKFLTISEARNLTSKSTKKGVLMSTAMTDVGFTFNGSQKSFFDEDFWSLVKHQFELNDDLKVIAAKEGLGLDILEYEVQNDRQKDQVPLGEDFEGMTGQHGYLNGKKNFPYVEHNRSKRRKAGGRKKHSRKNKLDLIFLISMGSELPTNMSDLEVKNMTDVGEKHEQQQRGLKDPLLGKAEKSQVITDDADLVSNEVHDDIITSRRNAVRDEPPRFRRKLLQYERINVDSGKGFHFIKNGTEIESRQKREQYPQNSWCCLPKLNLNAHLRCTIWSHKKVCVLTCRSGYSFDGKKKVKTCCQRNNKDKKWSPAFKPCEKDSSKQEIRGNKAGNKEIDEFYDDDEEESMEPYSKYMENPLGKDDYNKYEYGGRPPSGL